MKILLVYTSLNRSMAPPPIWLEDIRPMVRLAAGQGRHTVSVSASVAPIKGASISVFKARAGR